MRIFYQFKCDRTKHRIPQQSNNGKPFRTATRLVRKPLVRHFRLGGWTR